MSCFYSIKDKVLSIIIPVYNEEKTVSSVLDKITRVDLGVKKEIVIVDDGSVDRSREIIDKFIKKNKKSNIKFVSKKNGGKGSAIREGLKHCTGDIVAIQDADLEYNPRDFKKLVKLIVEGKAKVVYGSRFLREHEPMYKIYYMGNKFLTLLTKVLYNSRISDMETCYKVFRSDVIKSLRIRANHFDMEPEITAKILKRGIKIREVPISYNPRSIADGKKINWRDGLQAIWTLVYWRFTHSSE